MKNKVLCFFSAFLVAFASVPFGAFAESVVFLDADKETAVNEFSAAEKVKAEVSFVAADTGQTSVITSGYDAMGKMVFSPIVEAVDTVAGEPVTHITSPVSISGVNKLKVFVWNFDSLTPVLKRDSVLNKLFSAEGLSDKFIANYGAEEITPYIVETNSTINVGELICAADGAEINNKYFSVAAEAMEGSTANAVLMQNLSDWKLGTVTFSGEGMLKLTVQDYDLCKPATMYVKVVAPVDRYGKVFENTDTYLYRVGNRNTVALSSLFKEKEEAKNAELPIVNTHVEINGDNAGGTYTPNTSDWAKGTILFSGTGVVTVSIKDDNSKTETLKLEVIDAKNITKAESATANDVVLLNDISGTFVVSNGHTFHGNGFTVTLPTASVKNVGNGFTGYISIGAAQDDGIANGGNLDNVRIEGPVYPEMYIYRDQAKITDTSDPDYGDGYNMRYFVNSVIVYGGNCAISNSYISGSRTALCLRGGNNVVVENTTLSGGAYANMQICAGSSVTFKNLTTVQTDVPDSYGKGKMTHGLGIAVDTDVVDVYIEGELKQYNWLCQAQWNEIVPSTYQSYFPKFFTNSNFSKYWHYLNGGETPYVNMGLIYACNWDTERIHDNRTTVDYGTQDATIAGVSGGIYSKINTVGGNAVTDSDIAEPIYNSPGFNPVAPVFKFDNTANNDDDDTNDANDTYCVYNEASGTLKIGLTGDSKTLDLSKVTIDKNGTALTYKKYLNGTEISGNSVTINAADGAKQTLTFKATVNDTGYDKDGNPKSGSIDYTWTVTVEVATLAYPAPVWNMGEDYQFDTSNCVYAYYKTSQGYGEAVPIYEGIKINYYDKTGTPIEKDLSGTTTHPTGSNNSNSNAFTYMLDDGATLTMKFSSGWKSGATTHQFTTYNNKVYIYPQSLDNDNYVRAKTTNQDFDVKISYTFTDPNGQSISQQMQWYNAKDNNGKVTTVQWKTFDSTNGKNTSICVTGDALVMLADGSCKRIDETTYDDEILAWDFYEGEYVTEPVSLLISHGYDTYEVIGVTFDDGTKLDIVGAHGIYNKTLNEFVDINSTNVSSFIGHNFQKVTESGFKEVKLTSYDIRNEYNSSYTILSSNHHNAVLNGMLTISPSAYAENLYEPFEVGGDMKYDEEKMKKDIETYGLYTYDEFSQYLTKEQFDKWGIANMKITVGKGYTTYETILMMLKAFAIPNV